MVVLILGASSILGQKLAIEFARENVLILVGRNHTALQRLKKEVEKENNAEQAIIIVHDLEKGIGGLIEEIGSYKIDVIINAASLTSQFNDSEILPQKILSYTMVDLMAPLELIEHLVGVNIDKYKTNAPLRIIFISSWVSGIKSPDRNIYASFKFLQESFLRRIEALHKGYVKLTIVRIGARFSRNKESAHHKRISKKVFGNYRTKDFIFYGISGRLLYYLYYICPMAMTALIHTGRSLRALKKDSS